MIISQSIMDHMHNLQYEMLRNLIIVMDELSIKYYFVHGSLLGAVRDNDFIPEDDDIDIALFRSDYNKLMMEGNELLGQDYFLQNSANDNYPLPFAKLRMQNTAFIQPVLKNIKCNQGIYIDIFPLDFEGKTTISKYKIRLLDRRISQIFPERPRGLKNKIVDIAAKCFCLSYYSALLKRERLLSSNKSGEYVCIHGGKSVETHMPAEWFRDIKQVRFRDIYVNCPAQYDKYLTRIYGKDYFNHNPATTRIIDRQIEISAEILDFEKSYLDYQ